MVNDSLTRKRATRVKGSFRKFDPGSDGFSRVSVIRGNCIGWARLQDIVLVDLDKQRSRTMPGL